MAADDNNHSQNSSLAHQFTKLFVTEEGFFKSNFNGLNKAYIEARLGIPPISKNLKDRLTSKNNIVYERYSDNRGEIQLLYKDSELQGIVMRNFLDKKSLEIPLWTGTKKWVFGEDSFKALNDEPNLKLPKALYGRSGCQMDYWGRPGGYNEFIFASNIDEDVPHAPMIVDADAVCSSAESETSENEECIDMLLFMTCTYGEDFEA